jgi:hypothetical protein
MEIMGWKDTIKTVPDEAETEARGWRATIKEQDASPTPPVKSQPDISTAESFGRGVAEDVSFGFIDELAGGLEAAGSRLGIRGLGGKLSDLRFETEADARQTADQIYRQARDAKRAEQAAAKEAHPTAFLAGEVTGGIAGAFVPGVGWVSSGGKLAAKTTTKAAAKAGMIGGAKSGAIYGAGKAEELEDVPLDVAGGAVVGGVAGAALGAALEKVGQKAKQYFRNEKPITEAGTQAVQAGKPLPDDVLDAMGRSETPLSMEIFEKAVAEHPKAKFPGIEGAARDKQFVLSLTGNKANEKVDDRLRQKAMDLMHGMDDELLKEQWLTRKVKGDALAEAAEHAIRNQETAHQLANIPELKALAKVFVDPVQFGSKIDDRTGVPMTRILDKIHERANLASVETATVMKEAGDTLKQARWAKGDDANIDSIRQLRKTKKAVTPQQKKLEEIFESLRTKFNKNHKMNIAKLEGEPYIPRYATDRGTVYTRMNKRLKKFDKLDKEAREEVIEAAQSMNSALGREAREFTSPKEIRAVLGEWVRDKNVNETLNKNVFNAMMRKGPDLPILLQETDPSKLVMRYIQGNTRAAYMQEPLAELQNAVRALDVLKQTQARDYFQKFASDMASASGTDSIFQRGVRNPWMRTVDRILPEDSILKDNIKYIPDLLDWSSSNVYANLMGFRLDAPIRNMTTQPFFLTAPELTGGSKYGYKLIGKAYGKMIKDLFKVRNLPFNGQIGHMENQLQKAGIQSAQHNLEASLPAFENGIRSVPGLGHGVKLVDKIAEVGMWLYTKSDTVNRYITLNATHDLVDAMHKGSKEAADSIKHWPASVRHEVARHLKAKNVDDAKRVAAMYMNDK